MGEANKRGPAWAIRQVQELLAHPAWKHEHKFAPMLWRATKFVVDFRDLPPKLFEHAAEFGADLAHHSAVTLPFNECVFAVGPFFSDETGEGGNFYGAPTRDQAPHFYVCLCWSDGEYIYVRAYIAPQYPTYSDRTLPAVSITRIRLATDAFAVDNTSVGYDDIDYARLGMINIDDNARRENMAALRVLYGTVGFLSSRGVERIAVGATSSVPLAGNGTKARFSYYLLRAKISGVPNSLRSHDTRRDGVRLHWRRGHVRRRATGKLIIVRPHLVGDLARGVIAKDYALVGSASAPAVLTSEVVR